MHLIKLILAYDGTDFHGWQIQSGKPTVQGAVTDVLRKITQEKTLAIHGAGRTDAGVHALGQVAHFRTRSELRPDEIQRALNALLPPSIRIVAAEEVGPDFHSRWASLGKTYHYRIFRGRVVPPFECRYVLHYPYPLDEDAMCRAARLFEGEHDFTSFAASTGSEEEDRGRSMLRAIFRSELLLESPRNICSAGLQPGSFPSTRRPSNAVIPSEARTAAPSRDFGAQNLGALEESAVMPSEARNLSSTGASDLLIYSVRGRSFLRYMVRKMVGTLLDVGRGRLTPDDIPRLFDLRDRSKSGPTVPPHGLFLISVDYPDPANSLSYRRP